MIGVEAAAALAAVGLGMLCVGGNWLVDGGVRIARRLRISPFVIGMTVVAYGTSTPELAASIAAAGEHGGLILGNVVGSNIANVGMVIGVSAVAATVVVRRGVLTADVPIMIGFSMLLVALSADGEISRHDGAFLIVSLAAFSAYAYRRAWKVRGPPDGGGDGEGPGRPAAAGAPPAAGALKFYAGPGAKIAAGVALLGAGAWLAVENAVVLAQSFGLSERLIGITVIAVGTSLPELVTSVVAIRKGHTDIGIGNIIGSNIYNILMITGVAAAMAGIAVAESTFADYAVMIGFSLALLVGLRSGALGRPAGAALVAAYCAYLAFAFLAG